MASYSYDISSQPSTNAVLSVELVAAGTRWSANAASRGVFESHLDGSQWMIYHNTINEGLYWDHVSTRSR